MRPRFRNRVDIAKVFEVFLKQYNRSTGPAACMTRARCERQSLRDVQAERLHLKATINDNAIMNYNRKGAEEPDVYGRTWNVHFSTMVWTWSRTLGIHQLRVET